MSIGYNPSTPLDRSAETDEAAHADPRQDPSAQHEASDHPDQIPPWEPLPQPGSFDRAEFSDPAEFLDRAGFLGRAGFGRPDDAGRPDPAGPPIEIGSDRVPPRHAGGSRRAPSIWPRLRGTRTDRADSVAGDLAADLAGGTAGDVADDVPGGAGRSGPSRHAVLALVAILGLGVVLGWQTYQLDVLNDRLAGADRRFGEALLAENARAAAIEARTAELEEQAGAAFNPQAISAAVLPSVFRVRAGGYTGTAFAVGDKAGEGRANLLTNYHVIESVWEAGKRRVYVERGGDEVPATIVGANEDKDLAHLRLERDAKGLGTASVSVQAGQQIVVVGAPLGLEDSVTTGVVSAFRKDRTDGEPVIQFDAPINPGNSGGPVINSAREVVGLATAKARDAEGIGLAIPIQTACATFAVC